MIVLAQQNNVTGEMDTDTGIFVPREWTAEETQRYNSLKESEVVLAKQDGVTGELSKDELVFTPREWTAEETARYNSAVQAG
jgi:hypothetical protein